MPAKDWLSPPKPLWNIDTNARTHRHGNNGRSAWSSRDPSQAEEEYAVHEALRESTVKLWRELYQRMTAAEKRVKELEARLKGMGIPDP